MTFHKPILWVAAVGLALVLAACSSHRSPGATDPGAGPTGSAASLCHGVSASSPRWLPHDLRLPKGTFATATLADRAGFHRAVFMIPMPIAGFRRFVSKRWPAAGYVLGRMAVGERHFSGSFVKQPARGTFLAQERCGGKESVLFLGYAASPPSPSSS